LRFHGKGAFLIWNVRGRMVMRAFRGGRVGVFAALLLAALCVSDRPAAAQAPMREVAVDGFSTPGR